MPLLNFSHRFLSKPNLFSLLVLVHFLLVFGLPVEAQTPTKKNVTAEKKLGKSLFEQMKANPWANIKGFRSAKFGADEKSIYRAISKDFKFSKSKVKKTVHPSEKTTILSIIVPDLFNTGGNAKVAYILGYKTKKLIHVNVFWGKVAGNNVSGKSIVLTANLLRTHFMKKRYAKEHLIVNGKINDSTTMIFRGKDKKSRMITLVLSAHRTEAMTKEEAISNVSLVLSYIGNFKSHDVALPAEVKEGEF